MSLDFSNYLSTCFASVNVICYSAFGREVPVAIAEIVAPLFSTILYVMTEWIVYCCYCDWCSYKSCLGTCGSVNCLHDSSSTSKLSFLTPALTSWTSQSCPSAISSSACCSGKNFTTQTLCMSFTPLVWASLIDCFLLKSRSILYLWVRALGIKTNCFYWLIRTKKNFIL